MIRSIAYISMTLLPLALLTAACSVDGQTSDTDSGSGGMSEGSGEGGGSGSGGGGGSDESVGEGEGEGSATGGEPLGPDAVGLGAAGDYVILAKSAIANVPTSLVTGDLGLSPAAASYITGFDLTKAGTKWSSAQVLGDVYAADNDPPTPTALTTAVTDMQTAYTDAAGRKNPKFLDLGAGTIGGLNLAPGLYRWTSTVSIPTDITLTGEAEAVWIFQITGDLELSADTDMILAGGAQARNILWQVAGSVDLGTGSHAEGVVLSQTEITLGTGSSINGRLLAQTAVQLAGSTVTEPAP